MLSATCHCGAVRIHIPRKPRSLTNCNCSICRRYGVLWAYYRDAEVKLETLKVTGPGGVSLDATGVHYAAEVPVDGEFVDAIARIGADRARISGFEYGPVRYDVSFRHLHGPTLAALTRELRRVTEKQTRSSDPAAALAMFDDPALQSAFRQLLLAKPRLVIDQISASTPQGPFSIKGEAHFTDLHSSDLSGPSFMLLLTKLEAQADISVPASWATMAGSRVLPKDPDAAAAEASGEMNVDELGPQAQAGESGAQALVAEEQPAPAPGAAELDELVRRGFVKRDGQLVTTHVEFRQGKLLLNGRSFGE